MHKYVLLLLFLCNFSFSHADKKIESEIINSFRGMDKILEEEYPDTFAGLYIQREPEFKIVLMTTDLNRKHELTRFVPNPRIFDYVKFVEVEHSFRELVEAQKTSSELMKKNNITSDSSIYIMDNKVVVYIEEKNMGMNVLENKEISDSKFSSIVDIQYVKQLSQPHAALPIPSAGFSFTNAAGAPVCTGGFHNVGIFGIDAVFTAGHCGNVGEDELHANGGEFHALNINFGGRFDYQTRHSTIFTMGSNKIQTCHGGCLLAITGEVFGTQQIVGEIVCKYGHSSGNTCGEIVSKNNQPSHVPNAIAAFTEVKPIATDSMSTFGDSGGPYYSGTNAYGILSGGIPANGHGIYMGLTLLTRVVTSSP